VHEIGTVVFTVSAQFGVPVSGMRRPLHSVKPWRVEDVIGKPLGLPQLASASAFFTFVFYRQQRAHQQPRSGRHTNVRPYLQAGPATRQATVSIGEKSLAAERRPSALPVIASAVKTPASSINDAAIIANAYFRMSPSQEEKAPRSGALDARLRAAEFPSEGSIRSPDLKSLIQTFIVSALMG
jgi:hypothetical protein